MFRKFSVLLHSPFRCQGISLLRSQQITRYPIALYSVASPNKPKIDSPFKISKSKISKNLPRSAEAQNYTQAYAIDEILKQNVTRCLEIVNQGNLNQKYNQKSLDMIVDSLWNSYLGVRKVLEKSERLQDNRNSNRVDFSTIYIPNAKIVNKTILDTFESLIKNLTVVYKQNEQSMLNNPKHLLNALRCYSKFEKFHEHEEFWEIIYRITGKFIEQQGDPSLSDINIIRALIKALSMHKYYCKIQCNKTSQEENLTKALNKVKTIEEKALKFIIQHKNKESLTGWMSLMFQFQSTNDELIADLPMLIQKKLQDDRSVISEVPHCLNKASKFSDHPIFAGLIETMKTIALASATQNKLSIKEISQVMRSLSQKKSSLSEKEFIILWKNLNHNINEKLTKDLDFFSVSSLMGALVFNNHLNDERCFLLQQLAITALDNLNKPSEPAREESLEEENEDEEGSVRVNGSKMSDYLLVSESIKILGNISQQLRVKTINGDLVKKMVSILQDKNQKIQRGNLSNLLLSCAKLHEKSQATNQDFNTLERPLIDLFTMINKRLIADLQTFNAIDRAKAFIAYCILQEGDEQIYRILSTAVQEKLSQVPVYLLSPTLRGISKWKAKNQIDSEDPIEDAVIQKTLQNVGDLSKDMFFDLILNLRRMENLTSVKKIGSKMETELLNRIETFSIQEICIIITKDAKIDLLSPETLIQISHRLLKKVNKANITELSQLTNAYVYVNVMPDNFFEKLEETVFSHIKTFVGKKLPKEVLSDCIKIFKNLTKSKFGNRELINTFEIVFQEHLENISMLEVIQIVNAMVTYISPNIDLLRSLLNILNKMTSLEENQRGLTQETPSRTMQTFHLAMFSIELEYRQSIKLEDYSDIYKIKRYLDENIDKVRYTLPNSAKYQAHIAEELKDMGYSFEEEYPIGLFLVDIFIKPNIAIEVFGPAHFISGTKTLDLRSQRRIRQLKKLGYKVVQVPYFEWMDIEISALKHKYLKEKIED